MARKILNSFSSLNLERTEVFQNFERQLNEDKWFKPLLNNLENSLKLNRVYIVTGCSSLLVSLLLYHFGIQLICGAAGFLYPGYQTIECLEKFGEQEGKRWLTYWLVFSAFNFAEIFFFFLYWLPGYWIIKCLFFAWCYSPIPVNGSDIIYNSLIRPFFLRNQEAIDETINHLMKTAHTVCLKAEANMERNAQKHLQGHRD